MRVWVGLLVAVTTLMTSAGGLATPQLQNRPLVQLVSSTAGRLSEWSLTLAELGQHQSSAEVYGVSQDLSRSAGMLEHIDDLLALRAVAKRPSIKRWIDFRVVSIAWREGAADTVFKASIGLIRALKRKADDIGTTKDKLLYASALVVQQRARRAIRFILKTTTKRLRKNPPRRPKR